MRFLTVHENPHCLLLLALDRAVRGSAGLEWLPVLRDAPLYKNWALAQRLARAWLLGSAVLRRAEQQKTLRSACRCKTLSPAGEEGQGSRRHGHTVKELEPAHCRHKPHDSVRFMANAARLILLVVATAALASRSDGAWCVCRTDLPDSALQKTLDYACGDGADCKPILQNGACFAPDTVKAHCSYAVNSFYQRNNQNPQACVFSGTTLLTTNDPSGNGCQYPASPSTAGTSTTTTGGNGGSGVYSPHALGPSPFDNNGAGILPVVGIAKRVVILACCALMVLCFRA